MNPSSFSSFQEIKSQMHEISPVFYLVFNAASARLISAIKFYWINEATARVQNDFILECQLICSCLRSEHGIMFRKREDFLVMHVIVIWIPSCIWVMAPRSWWQSYVMFTCDSTHYKFPITHNSDKPLPTHILITHFFSHCQQLRTKDEFIFPSFSWCLNPQIDRHKIHKFTMTLILFTWDDFILHRSSYAELILFCSWNFQELIVSFRWLIIRTI